MIFKPEMVEKILAGEKTVTRRPLPKHPVTGEPSALFACRYEMFKDYAVQPGRGKHAVARIRIQDVSRGIIVGCDAMDARLEGSESVAAFRDYWTDLYGSYDPTQLVDRIEFELVEDA